MPKISSSLLKDMRALLQHIEAFDSDRTLKALFITNELRTFRNDLPETSSKNERIDMTIAYLIDKTYSTTGENGLLLFLHAVQARVSSDDDLHQKLERLAIRLEAALSSQANDMGAPAEQRPPHRIGAITGGAVASPIPTQPWAIHGLIWSAGSFTLMVAGMLTLATPLRCILEYRLTETIVALLVGLAGGGFVVFRNLLSEGIRAVTQYIYGGVMAGLLVGIVVAVALPKVAEISCSALVGGPSLVFDAAAEDETLLIVVPFAGRLNDVAAFPERYVRDALNERVVRLRQADRPARLEMWVTPVTTQQEAREIGSSYGATLVVWGEFDDVGGARAFIEIMRDVPQADVQLAGNWLDLGTLEPSQSSVSTITRDCLLKALPAQADSLASVALGMIQLVHGQPAEAERLLTQVIDTLPAVLDCGADLSAAYYWRGFARSLQENYPSALEDLDRAVSLRRNDPLAEAQRGIVQLAIGRIDEAAADFQGALTQVDPTNTGHRAALIGNIGLTHELRGELDQALRSYQQAEQLTQEHGDPLAKAWSAGHLGSLFLRTRDLDQAQQYYTQSLELCRSIGYKRGEAVALGNLGLVAYERGDVDTALKQFTQALALNKTISSSLGQGQQLLRIGVIQIKRQQLEAARTSYTQARTLFEAAGSLAGQGRAYIGLALVEQQHGNGPGVVNALEHALAFLERIGSPDATLLRQQLQQIRQ